MVALRERRESEGDERDGYNFDDVEDVAPPVDVAAGGSAPASSMAAAALAARRGGSSSGGS